MRQGVPIVDVLHLEANGNNMRETIIAVLVGLSIGVTSIAMQTKGGDGGYNGAGDIVKYNHVVSEQVGGIGGAGGGTMWTEKIRRENDDGTYYYVYKDHGSATVVYATGSKK